MAIRVWPRGFAPTAGLVALILVGSGMSASAQGAAEAPEVASVRSAVRVPEVELGASDDASAVSAAAAAFEPGDASSIAKLADATSAATANALTGSDSEIGVDVGVDGVATVDVSGASATLGNGAGLQFGISAAGDGAETSLVEGVTVTQDISEGLDVVTRAVPNGVQMIAVLADKNADTEIDFNLDVPTGARLDR